MRWYSSRSKNVVTNLGPGSDKWSKEIGVSLPVTAQAFGCFLQTGLQHYGRSIVQRMRQRSIRVYPLEAILL
jgi:hypothetical protein